MNETGNIINENPQNHWCFLKVNGLRVLDLGCGRTWGQEPTTPEYFLQKGAIKVTGVEMWPKECEYLTELINSEKAEIIPDEINTIEKVKHYLQEIDVVKCDIEGAEKYLNDLTIDDLKNIKEMAVEFHSADMRHMLIDKFQIWGFKNIYLYSIGPWDVNIQGVIHLTR